jgi:hypothetical protein
MHRWSGSSSRTAVAPAKGTRVWLRHAKPMCLAAGQLVDYTVHNAGDTRVAVTADGVTMGPAPVEDLPCVVEFDPASLVLTAFGVSTPEQSAVTPPWPNASPTCSSGSGTTGCLARFSEFHPSSYGGLSARGMTGEDTCWAFTVMMTRSSPGGSKG